MEKNQLFWNFAIQLEQFCSYQERCLFDVNLRMTKLEIPDNLQEALIDHLLEEGFFSDLRYAQSFTRGKFNSRKWGKRKILNALKIKRIKDHIIYESFAEIQDEEYLNVLQKLMNKKTEDLGGIKDLKSKKKLVSFLLQRGFESHLIWELLNQEN